MVKSTTLFQCLKLRLHIISKFRVQFDETKSLELKLLHLENFI